MSSLIPVRPSNPTRRPVARLAAVLLALGTMAGSVSAAWEPLASVGTPVGSAAGPFGGASPGGGSPGFTPLDPLASPDPTLSERPTFAPTPLALSNGAAQNFSPYAPSAFTHGQVPIAPNGDGFNIANLPTISVNQTGNLTVVYNGTWNPAPGTASDRDWVLAFIVRNGSPQAMVLEANTTVRVSVNASQLPFSVYFGLPTPASGASPTSTARIIALPPGGNLTVLNLTASNAGISLAGNAAVLPLMTDSVWFNASGAYGGSGILVGAQSMVVFVPADGAVPVEVRAARLTQWANASHFPGGRFLALKGGNLAIVGGSFAVTVWTRGSPESSLYLNATVNPTAAVRPDTLNVTGSVGNRSLEQTAQWNVSSSAVLSASGLASTNCNSLVRLLNGSYRIFCTWSDSSGPGTQYGVNSAYSPDGRNWAWEPGTRYSQCGGEHSITQVAIVRLLDGRLRMYYGGADPGASLCSILGNAVRTSSATSLNEGVTWTLETDGLSDFGVTSPDVRAVVPTTAGQLRMYLESVSGLATALSDDGVTWAFEAAITASVPRTMYTLTSGAYKMYFGTSTVQSRISANGLAWSSVQTEVPQWGDGAIEAGPILDRGDGVPSIMIYSQSNGLYLAAANQSVAPAARVDVAGRLSDSTPFGAGSVLAGARGAFQVNSSVPAAAPLGRYQLTASAGFGENKFRGVVLNRAPSWTGRSDWNATEDVPLVINLSSQAADPDVADTLAFFASSPYLTMNGSVATLLYPDGVPSDVVLGVINDGHDNTLFSLVVTVAPVNDPPTLALNASYSVTEDQLSLVDLRGAYNDEETGRDQLNLSTDLPGAVVTNGQVAVLLMESGNVTVTVTVSDGTHNVSATTVFVVAPTDDPPLLALPPEFHGDEGALIVIDFGPYLSDVDTPPADFVLTTNLTPSTVLGLSVSLQRDLPMTIPFNITVRGGDHTATASAVLVIDPTNDRPTWTGAPDLSALLEDIALDIDLAGFASDEEKPSSLLTFSTTSAYATINGTHLILVYPNSVLTETFDLTVSDGMLTATKSVTATIEAVNDLPTISNSPPENYAGPGPIVFQFEAGDVDDTSGFVFDLNASVPWITVTPGGLLTISPPNEHGRFSYWVRVRDASGVWSEYETFAVALPLNGLPQMEPSFARLPANALLDTLFTVNFNGTDPDGDNVTATLDGTDPTQVVSITPLPNNVWRISWTPNYPGPRADPFIAFLTGNLTLDDSFGTARFPFAFRAHDPPSNAPFIDGIIPEIVGEPGREYTFDLTKYMKDGDALDVPLLDWSFEPVSTNVAFLSHRYDPLTHILTVNFSGEGQATILFRLFDPGHLSDTQYVDVRSAATVATSDFPWWLLLLVAAGAAAAGAVIWRSRASAALAEVVPSAAPPGAGRTPTPPPQATPAARPPPVVATAPRRSFLVEDVFLLYRDGRTIFARSGLGADAVDDPESVGAMLIAVQDFVKDSFRKNSPVDRMGYGDNVILLEQGEYSLLAVTVFGEPDREFRELLSETEQNVEASYAGVIEAWSGNKADFRGVEAILAPVWQLTAHLTRGDVLLATTAREVQMLSGVEFFQGFVRLKVGVVNNTTTVITNVTVDLDHNADVLRLHKIEPSGYKAAGAKVNLGVLQAGEKATLAYYFDPQICTMSMIDGTARYKDPEGNQHVVQMKSRKAEVVCPLFFTKEQANTAMLRRLVETELNQFDVRAFEIGAQAKAGELAALYETIKSCVLAHDVQLVRAFERHNPYAGEAWFYGKTQVKGYQMVIRAVVDAEKGRAEFFVASTVMRSVTGLLAELSHQFHDGANQRLPSLGITPLFDETLRNAYSDVKAVSKMIEGEADAGETESP